jgi:DNA modification methylase
MHGWRHAFELLTAARKVYELMNVCIWNKSNGGMGGLYRSKHEFVFVLRNGSAPHVNNVQLGRSGRNRTNVWDYPAVSRFRREPLDELILHPTVKPVALVADAIKDCSKRRGLVLDPFVGSGSTMIAAEKTGRVAYGLELDPRHVDTAIRRWAHYAGEPAIHDGTGLTADQLATQRSAAPMPPQGG